MLASALTIVPAFLIGMQFFKLRTEKYLKIYIYFHSLYLYY